MAKLKTVKAKPPRWWEEEATEEQLRARGASLERRVQRLQGMVREMQLRMSSYRGEIRSLLFDKPRALGKTSDEIIEELLEEQHQRKLQQVAGKTRKHNGEG